MGWADYGFPDPTMCANHKPAYGIYLAHKERYELPRGKPYPVGVLYSGLNFWQEPELFMRARAQLRGYLPGTSSNNFTLKDDILLNYTDPVVYLSNGNYVNHLLNMGVEQADVYWTRESLTNEVMSRRPVGEEYIPYEYLNSYDTTVGNRAKTEWKSTWAQQYYIRLNLCKLAVMPSFIMIRGFGESQGTQNSPEAAYNSAIANYHIATQDELVFLSTWTTLIQGSGSNWRCFVSAPITLEASYADGEPLPESLRGLPSYLYSMCSLNYFGYYDPHDTDFKFTQNGMYSRTSLPYNAPIPPLPLAFKDGIFGPYYGAIDLYRAVATMDLSSAFEFYDNVDEIPTP
jgi:hypothetical protein